MRLVEIFEDVCPTSDRLVTQQDLNYLEEYLDKIFRRISVDINLTGRHFVDRINDDRNGKQISICELREIFKEFYKEHYDKFGKMRDGFEAVLNDISSDINLPFIIKYDRRNRELDLVAKTIMRKRDFKSPDPKLKVKTGNKN